MSEISRLLTTLNAAGAAAELVLEDLAADATHREADAENARAESRAESLEILAQTQREHERLRAEGLEAQVRYLLDTGMTPDEIEECLKEA